MKLYTCKVRIMGEVKDEVRRSGVTNAEIKILKSIHGDDGVVDIEPEGEVERSEADERQRLEQFYGELVVAKLFGVATPRIADDIADAPGVAIPLEPPVRAEPKRPTKAVHLEDVA